MAFLPRCAGLFGDAMADSDIYMDDEFLRDRRDVIRCDASRTVLTFVNSNPERAEDARRNALNAHSDSDDSDGDGSKQSWPRDDGNGSSKDR